MPTPFVYKCGDVEKRRTCMVCKNKLQDNDEVVGHPSNMYMLRHTVCIPEPKRPTADLTDTRRFNRGRVINKPGGL